MSLAPSRAATMLNMFLINSLQIPIAFCHLQVKTSLLTSLDFACLSLHLTKFSISHVSYLNLAQNQARFLFLESFKLCSFPIHMNLQTHFVKYLKISKFHITDLCKFAGFVSYLAFKNKNCYYTCCLTIKLKSSIRNRKSSIWMELNQVLRVTRAQIKEDCSY